MAQLVHVASMPAVVLGGFVKVVGSNLARGKILTASIGSVDSLYLYVARQEKPVTFELLQENLVATRIYIYILITF